MKSINNLLEKEYNEVMENFPIITLTLNPAIDHIFTVDTLSLYNKNLIKDTSTFYGGKGINVAYALGKLGCDCTAAGFVGQKEQVQFTRKLASVAVNACFIPVGGKTRENYKVMDLAVHQDTEFNQPGFTVNSNELTGLMALLSDIFKRSTWLAVSGSLPEGVDISCYAEIIRLADRSGVKTCLDASGATLRAGLAAKPAMLRINRSELEEALNRKMDEPAEVTAGIHSLIDSDIEMVIVSLGKQGVIGSNGSESWSVSVPEVPAIGLTGAGDTLTAGCLYGLSQGKSFSEMLRFGSALATAGTLKLEPGDFDPQDLEVILPQTTLQKL